MFSNVYHGATPKLWFLKAFSSLIWARPEFLRFSKSSSASFLYYLFGPLNYSTFGGVGGLYGTNFMESGLWRVIGGASFNLNMSLLILICFWNPGPS